MLRLFDRYILKEVTTPFGVGVIGCCFVLMANELLRFPELFIARGVPFGVSVKLLTYLLPSILSFAVPMSVMIGVLAGLSRLSSDSEILALKALGVSHARMFRPMLLFAFPCCVLSSVLLLYIAPYFNFRWVQTYSDSSRRNVQAQMKSGRFIEAIPNLVVYFQRTRQDDTWENVFVRLPENQGESRYLMARRGRLETGEPQAATLELEDVLQYSSSSDGGGEFSIASAARMVEFIEPDSSYTLHAAEKRAREKNIRELITALRAASREVDRGGDKHGYAVHGIPESDGEGLAGESPRQTALRDLRSYEIEIHKKFAVASVCLIYPFLGFPLGILIKKSGRANGFAVSLIIILVYHLLLVLGEKLAMDGFIPPWVGMWFGNMLFLLLGVALFIRSGKERSGDRVRAKLLEFGKKIPAQTGEGSVARRRIPAFFPNILDRYVTRKYLAVASLILAGAVTVSIIVTFSERIGSVWRHHKQISLFFGYLFFRIPEFVYFGLPLTVLIATVLTLGLLGRLNEVIAMKAAGVSTLRILAPFFVLAVVSAAFSFYLEENVLSRSNREAAELWDRINDVPPRSYGYSDRHWIADKPHDRFFEFAYFDPHTSTFGRLSQFDLDAENWTLKRYVHSKKASLHNGVLSFTNCRSFELKGFSQVRLSDCRDIESQLADSGLLSKEEPDPSQMRFAELRRYIHEIGNSGIDATRLRVDLSSKISFPLAVLVLALIGTLFGSGMRGPRMMLRVGGSLILALVFWLAIGIFRSLGYAGYLYVIPAAWGPNLLFGAVGLGIFARRSRFF